MRDDRHERIAFILCGRSYIARDPWNSLPEERFLSRKIILLPKNSRVDTRFLKHTRESEFFIKLCKEAKEENLAIAVVHSLSALCPEFDVRDTDIDKNLFLAASDRFGIECSHASLAITINGEIYGIAWDPELHPHHLDLIRIYGDQFKFYYPSKGHGDLSRAFQRQILAFGQSVCHVLSQLRIAVVGCGGTGSATAIFLTRLGVGNILLIDGDHVDETNLNRLHCASLSDAVAKKPKVEVLKTAISNIGLKTEVRGITKWVEADCIADALKSCDIVFGCTDDHRGRLLLNRLAYFYLLPVIDMGLLIRTTKSDPPEISLLCGRVTVLFPREICLLCRNVIDPNIAYAQELQRRDPEHYKDLKKEFTFTPKNEQTPSVITFSTEVASMAVNEFIHRIQGFRGLDGSASERLRLFEHCEDIKTGGKIHEDCDLCDKKDFWGRGDMHPFLNREDTQPNGL